MTIHIYFIHIKVYLLSKYKGLAADGAPPPIHSLALGAREFIDLVFEDVGVDNHSFLTLKQLKMWGLRTYS